MCYLSHYFNVTVLFGGNQSLTYLFCGTLLKLRRRPIWWKPVGDIPVLWYLVKVEEKTYLVEASSKKEVLDFGVLPQRTNGQVSNLQLDVCSMLRDA